ncbi:hypothetical protein BC939DRAFT_437039 [Gamsiella multidivaricata]|uniref:uncharacterized protein n=1 Tax=Gamsiella multidivaricata TaxID=101098 RepID=UPI00221FF3D1|nr:uncharacterized protein BC939DRAFT_437039 [Gamsiella multidivaricata]KAG0367451.1 START domain-containing protein 10 [Gamsiella multidivaricata]KAI7831451.1 hypothetical protein BC939DRAFT_437039 [Gamsiella multidivaricata]
MGDTAQSPLAMLVLVTPYTLLYLVNQVFLHGVLDKMHYIFFELIFVLAFRKVFGIPDLGERLFPSQVAVHATEPVQPAKTSLISSNGEATAPAKKKVKKIIVRKASGTATKKTKEQPYAKELAAMKKKFMDYVENKEIWEKVFEETSPGLIEVYQYKARPMCYKIIAVMNNTAAVTFDLLSDINRRVEWDPLCVEAKMVADVSPGVKIQYVRTKSMWPTASRDTVVLGTVGKLSEETFFNVTSSVEHPLMPERIKEKFVRMETAIAGQIVGPEPGQPNRCRLVQVLDADLKGWIPEKVIQLVSTKAVPEGIRNVNGILPSLTPYDECKTLERVALARKEAEALAEQQGDDENDAVEESSHELKSKRASDMLSSSSQLADRLANGNGKQYGHGPVERKRSSTFRVFWEGVKQNLGYGGAPGKANRILVMTIVLAVLGPTIARFRRRR